MVGHHVTSDYVGNVTYFPLASLDNVGQPRPPLGHFYRPQRSCGQGNIFTPVCHSFCSQGGGGGVPQCMLGYHHPPDQAYHPPWTSHPPRPATPPPPQTRHPHPLDQPHHHHPPRTRHTLPQTRHPPRTSHPPREADSSIRSTSGRYASYWNAFLFFSFSCNLGENWPSNRFAPPSWIGIASLRNPGSATK